MTLLLHAGAGALDYSDLRQLETPEATRTHVPIPHHRLVDVVRRTFEVLFDVLGRQRCR